MNRWSQMHVKEIGKVVTGKTPPTKDSTYFKGKYPFITPTDIPDYQVRTISSFGRYLSENWKLKASNYLLPPNTICYVCIGSTVGKSCLTNQPSFSNQQINSIICNPEHADYNFLFYLFKHITPELKRISEASGAGKGIINKTSFENISLLLPDVTTQREISSTISIYDKLIENNEKRIKILEEMAQSLYTEWFVKFRFPGHEKVKMVDNATEYGMIPEGWKVSAISSVVNYLEGPGIRNWQYRQTGVPFLNIRTIENGEIDISKCNYLDTETTLGKYSHFMLRENDVIVSSSGTLGRIAVIRKTHLPLCLNTSIIRFRETDDGAPIWFIKQYLLSDFFQNKILSLASGSAQLNYGPSHLNTISLLVPTEQLIKEYDELIKPIEEENKTLRDTQITLTETRDLLIPQLVTGRRELKNE